MFDAYNCIFGDLKRIYLRSKPGWSTLGKIVNFNDQLNLVELTFINEKGKTTSFWFQKFSGMAGTIKNDKFIQISEGTNSYYLSKEKIFPYEKSNFSLTETPMKIPNESEEVKKSEKQVKPKRTKKLN